jgi:hypothetical protein
MGSVFIHVMKTQRARRLRVRHLFDADGLNMNTVCGNLGKHDQIVMESSKVTCEDCHAISFGRPRKLTKEDLDAISKHLGRR